MLPASLMQPGALRRKAFLAWFDQDIEPVRQLAVNNKWQFKSSDPDLAYLLKKGILEQTRRAAGLKGGKGQTYLVRTAKASPYKRQQLSKTSEVSANQMLRTLLISKGCLYRWNLGYFCTIRQPEGHPFGEAPKRPWIGTVAFQQLVGAKKLTPHGELFLASAEY